MSTINIDLAADTILNVMIGQQDENEVREVIFDFSGWYTTYGSGTISLAIQRPKDEWPYEGTLTVDSTNHKATWEISETDTAYAGTGQIQLSYKVGDAKKKSVVYRFTCHKSLGALGSVVTPVQIQTFIDEVEEALQTMDGRLDDMDDQITDVKTDLQAIIDSGAGMSEDFKQALHDILEKVAYINEDGQDYLDALDNAMWPPANLVSISAVYTQSGTVYDTDTLDSLKSDLVVTAHMSDSTTQTVTTYTLSGTLTEGTSTITVAYGGKTTTFNVTVTSAPVMPLYPLADRNSTLIGTSKLEISNGNHIKITIPSGTTISSTFFINLQNGTWSTSANNINNQPKWFTVPANKTAVFEVSNVTNNINYSFEMNFRKALASTSGSFGTGKDTHVNGATVTQTLDTAEDLSCVFVYLSNGSPESDLVLEFDITFTVDGERYI